MNKQETICFIDNYDRTPIFEKVSKYFELENVFWITLNSNVHDNLKKNFKEKNILYLNYSDKSEINNFIRENKLYEVFLSDRFLRNKGDIGFNFLKNIEGLIYNFIKLNKIKVIIGEYTWGHELLTHRIIKNNKLDCKYFNIQPLRYPYNRSGFFFNESQNEILKINSDTEKNLDFKNNTYSIKERKKSKNQIFKILVLLLKIFQRNYYRKKDIFFMSKFSKIKENLNIFFNSINYNLLKKKRFIINNNNFKILFALQKQPEASADVKSRYYEEQNKLILNILKTLSNQCDLYLKEHNAAIGLRDKKFYTNIIKYPNVYLLDHEFDLNENLKSFDLVISQAGTVSYEAAIKNIPSFTFADCFFNKLQNSFKINFEDLKNCQNIKELLNLKIAENKNKLTLREFENFLLERSFPGNIMGVYGNAEVIKNENIELLAKELKKLFLV